MTITRPLIEGRTDGRWEPPPGRGASRKYPWIELEIGESFIAKFKMATEFNLAKVKSTYDRTFKAVQEGRHVRITRTA